MPGGSASIRAFIAIDLPEETRQAISRTTGGLRAVAERGVKWVDPRRLHLTLKFLGETPPGKIDAIQAVLARCAIRHTVFPIQPDGLGTFPANGKPRVIWVGLQAPESLAELAAELERELAPLGFAVDKRPFSPHLTIGRVREDARPAELTPLQMALSARKSEEFQPFEVRATHLYRSELRPSGPIYTRMFTAPLSVYNTGDNQKTPRGEI